jgi:L-asparaginase
MKKILLLSTGGTFNKHYSAKSGEIAIDTEASTLKELADKWRTDFEISTIIGKDSLDMDDTDRELLIDTIQHSRESSIIIIHGTDTMDITAKAIADADISKRIVVTGAMVPYSIDPIEATANLCSAYG